MPTRSREKSLLDVSSVKGVRQAAEAGHRAAGLVMSLAVGSDGARKQLELFGAIHQTNQGGTLTAVSAQADNSMLVSYSLEQNGDSRNRVLLFRWSQAEDLLRLDLSVDSGVVDRAVDDLGSLAGSPLPITTAGRSCTSTSQCPPCYPCRCVDFSYTCAFNCCAACAFACFNPWGCLGCVAVYCPVCLSLNRCCRRKECSYRPGLYC